MLHKRITPTERVYHKVVEPSLGSFRAIPNTSHCCVRYHPSLVVPKSAPPTMCSSTEFDSGQAATEPLVATLPKIQVANRMTQSALEIGHNQLIPIYQPHKEDVNNLQRSATQNSFNSTSRVKQVPLPQVNNNELMRSSTPRGLKNVSISGDRYLGTSTRSQPQRSGVSRSFPQPSEAPSLPKREQVKRFEEEQSNLYFTRTLKRKSEIRSHRVDRMYYLCGSGVSAQAKYDVDEAELERLRQVSRSRNNSRANSGRTSSPRTRRTFTESSIMSDGRSLRSPRGTSERSSPVSRDDNNIALSVHGSSIGQEADEVKGDRSDKCQDSSASDGQAADGRLSQEGEEQEGDKADGVQAIDIENGEKGHLDHDAKDSQDQKTSPHRTGGEDCEGTNQDGQHKGQSDGQNETSGEKGEKDGDDNRTKDGRADGDKDDDEKKSSIGNDEAGNGMDNDGAGGTSDGRKGGEGGEEGGEGEDGDRIHKDNSAASGHSITKEGGGSGGGGDAEEIDDVTTDGRHGDASVDGAGDADEDEEGKNAQGEEDGGEKGCANENGAEGEHSGAGSAGSHFIESIAPGLNLDKTPVAMKKSDVYLTEFGDPRLAHTDEDDNSTAGDSTTNGNHSNMGQRPQLKSRESEITRMEQRLNRVAGALTQGVDDVGRLAAGSELDGVAEENLDGGGDVDRNGQSYDAGVFAKAKSKEEQARAAQMRRERMELRSAKREAAIKAQETEKKQKAESAWAKKKQTPQLKYKMAAIYNFISSRQREIFSHKFQELDVDGNGLVSLKELSKRMNKGVPKEDIKHLFKVFDLNKDKTIDEYEFITVAALNDKLTGKEITSEGAPLELNLQRLSLHITAYKEMFEAADQNGDGRLSIEEIMLIVSLSVGIEIGTDADVVHHIRDTVDTDSDGTIDFVEFLSYIPFFVKIHQDIIGRPVTINEIEEARLAVKKALGR